jgi:hypothetical protein
MFKDPAKTVMIVFGVAGLACMYAGGLSWLSIVGILLTYISWHLEFKVKDKKNNHG